MKQLDDILLKLLGEKGFDTFKDNLDKAERAYEKAKAELDDTVSKKVHDVEDFANILSDNAKLTKIIDKYKHRQRNIYKNKVAHNFNITNVYQETRYMLEEVAELMHAIEKNDKENIKEELADIVIFAYGLAAVAGVGDLDEEIFRKMKINEKRKYTKDKSGDFVKEPDEYCDEQ